MSSASLGSGTRRRMKFRSRDCSRVTTSEIRSSCSNAISSRLAALLIYRCRRTSNTDIVGWLSYCLKSTIARHFLSTKPIDMSESRSDRGAQIYHAIGGEPGESQHLRLAQEKIRESSQ